MTDQLFSIKWNACYQQTAWHMNNTSWHDQNVPNWKSQMKTLSIIFVSIVDKKTVYDRRWYDGRYNFVSFLDKNTY